MSDFASEAVRQLNEYHKKGYEFISKALEIDEKGSHVKSENNATGSNRSKAMEWYRKGIVQLEQGIAIDFSGCQGEKYERAFRLKEKMVQNLKMAQERLQDLDSSNNSSVSKSHVRAKTTTASGHRSTSADSNRSASSNKASVPRPVTSRGTLPAPASAAVRRDSSLNKSSKTNVVVSNKPRVPKGVDPHLGGLILDQILDENLSITFDNIAGLDNAKQALNEAVIFPAMNPTMFTGLLAPVQGLLLFGPPGNGKTMLAKAVAAEANCKFFNTSASALTSKWVGEAEKLVKALFLLARELQPSIIFIDEIDSILCERKDGENEVARRLKTEFLCQFDGVASSQADKILVMGATNRPFDLDDAVLRRFPKRIYVGLPSQESRIQVLGNLLKQHGNPLSHTDLTTVARLTDGYSFSDLTQLAKDVAFAPIREMSTEQLKKMSSQRQLRPINIDDFRRSVQRIRASSNQEHTQRLLQFKNKYGDVSDSA